MKPFRLPITYIECQTLSHTVFADLELPKVYHTLLQPSSTALNKPNIAHELVNQYTTTDTTFLRETQELIKVPMTTVTTDHDLLVHWRTLTEDYHFIKNNGYIEHPQLRFLNHSPTFMQCYSMFQLYSPLWSLLYPLLILILPFFLLIIMGKGTSVSNYIASLKSYGKSNIIGCIANFSADSVSSVAYFIFYIGMFVCSTYQNYVSCKLYHARITGINEVLAKFKQYCKHRIEAIREFINLCRDKVTYQAFCKDVQACSDTLATIVGEIPDVCFSLKNTRCMGLLLRVYYRFYDDEAWRSAIQYSFGFTGYLDQLREVGVALAKGVVTCCEFVGAPGSTKFVDQVYPLLAEGPCVKPVKNTVSLRKNLVLTGPNASGKTTLLKTTAINVILSQQFGVGYYGSGTTVCPYEHIYSYLNIPDTSERDSLFQAESRRCKEIIDQVAKAPTNHRHFCIFDELYSGTNPSSAVKTAYNLLVYMAKNPQIQFCLTTHYVDLCKQLRVHKDVIGLHKMDVRVSADQENIEYTYRLVKGISTVDVVWNILRDLKYPREILDAMQN